MRVLEVIAHGGFGRVEKVRLKDGTVVARKVFDPSPQVLAADVDPAKLRRRFEREVRVQASLDEDLFLPILDHDLDEDQPWFTMPLADCSYRDQIEEDRQQGVGSPEPLADILNGLEELHRLGFVHRDLKPENILLHVLGADVSCGRLLVAPLRTACAARGGELAGRLEATSCDRQGHRRVCPQQDQRESATNSDTTSRISAPPCAVGLPQRVRVQRHGAYVLRRRARSRTRLACDVDQGRGPLSLTTAGNAVGGATTRAAGTSPPPRSWRYVHTPGGPRTNRTRTPSVDENGAAQRRRPTGGTMRVAAWIPAFVMALMLPAFLPPAHAEEPGSLVLARRAVEDCRGKAHRQKMRVRWPAVEDEVPPDGAEVVIVRGYISCGVTRMVLHEDGVDAGTVFAGRSWFYNRQGEPAVTGNGLRACQSAATATWPRSTMRYVRMRNAASALPGSASAAAPCRCSGSNRGSAGSP